MIESAAPTRDRRRRRHLLGWPLPSMADLVFLTGLLGAVLSGSRMLSVDGDPARHLAVGEYILASGGIPRVDVFSHTMAGQPFVPYEWLAEVASAASFRAAGPAGPVLLHGAVIGLAFWVLLVHLRTLGNPPLLALVVTMLGLTTSMVHWLARPHIFTFLGTAVFAAILGTWFARGGTDRRVWWLVPTIVLWANAHGGFLVGLLVLGAYLGADVLRALGAAPEVSSQARRRLRLLGPVTAATLAATLLTPAGPGLLTHVTGYFGKSLLVNRTHEYLSPDFHEAGVIPFVIVLLGTVAAMAWSRRRPALQDVMLFAAFAAFALYARRNIPLFAIVAAPLLAGQLAALPPLGGWLGQLISAPARVLARWNASVALMDPLLAKGLWPALAVGGLSVVAANQWHAGLAPLDVAFHPGHQPVAAVRYLKGQSPAGNGFNELRWGGYLLHELWPSQRVFIDGQTDFYGERLTREYLDVVELAEGWQDVLARHGVQWVIYATDSALSRRLASTPGWQSAYRDDIATVFVRAP